MQSNESVNHTTEVKAVQSKESKEPVNHTTEVNAVQSKESKKLNIESNIKKTTKREISVNRLVRFEEGKITKPELKKKADDKNRFPGSWSLEDVTPSELLYIVGQGFTIKTGVTRKDRLGEEFVENIYWMFFDQDKRSIEESKKIVWTRNACLVYYTPSYVEGESFNHRIVFALSRSVNNREYKKIYAFLRSFYKDTDNTNSPAQCFFGAKSPQHVELLDENATLDVDQILTVIGENENLPDECDADFGDEDEKVKPAKKTNSPRKKKNTKEEKKKERITTKVLKYINTEIFLGVCNGDVNNFFKLWEHKLSHRRTDKKIQDDKYVGRLYGSNNPDGTGLSVTVCDEELPPTYYNRAEKETLNYLEYWYQCKKAIDPEYWDDDEFNLKEIINDITTDFKVEPFDFKSNKLFPALENFFDFEVKDSLFVQGWDLARVGTLYIYFNEKSGRWFKASEGNLCKLLLAPRFKTLYPDWRDMLEVYAIDNNMKKIPVVHKLLSAYLDDNPPESLESYPETNPNLIVMRNGVFNLETGELEENEGQAFNFTAPIATKYYPVGDDHPVIQNLKTYFRDWLGNDDEGDALLAYMILCVKRQAYRMKKILCLQGDSNKGKSAYAALIQNVMNGRGTQNDSLVAAKMTINTLLGNSSHETASIENKYFIYLDEINTLNPKLHDIEKLKTMTSEEHDRTMIIKPIYEAPRAIKTYFSMVAVSEEVIKFATSDGIDNRFAIVILGNNCNMNLKDRLTELQKNVEVIHNWCLGQDTDYWINKFMEISKSNKLKDNLVKQKRENEPLVEFIDTHFEITENKDDVVECDTIWELFHDWKEETHFQRKFASKQSFGRELTKILKQPKYGIEWTKKGGETLNGNGKRISSRRSCMKLKESAKCKAATYI